MDETVDTSALPSAVARAKSEVVSVSKELSIMEQSSQQYTGHSCCCLRLMMLVRYAESSWWNKQICWCEWELFDSSLLFIHIMNTTLIVLWQWPWIGSITWQCPCITLHVFSYIILIMMNCLYTCRQRAFEAETSCLDNVTKPWNDRCMSVWNQFNIRFGFALHVIFYLHVVTLPRYKS